MEQHVIGPLGRHYTTVVCVRTHKNRPEGFQKFFLFSFLEQVH